MNQFISKKSSNLVMKILRAKIPEVPKNMIKSRNANWHFIPSVEISNFKNCQITSIQSKIKNDESQRWEFLEKFGSNWKK